MASFVHCIIRTDSSVHRSVHINLDLVREVEPVQGGCAITFVGDAKPAYVVKGDPADILRGGRTNA
jgi:hypothetical protein